MQVDVRVAVPGDAEAIATAHIRAWQAAYEGIVPQSFLDSIDLAERVDLWSKILTGEITVEGVDRPHDVVAVVEGKVVGFANIGQWRDESQDHSCGELWAMYVNPDHWGVGAGYALMQATRERFDQAKYDTAYLWVFDANEQARKFYERQGWQDESVTRDEVIGDATIAERRYRIDLRA